MKMLKFAQVPGGLAAVVLLQACASAPRVERPESPGLALESVKDEDATRIRRMVDRRALAGIDLLGIPTVELAPAAVDARISPTQSELVLNRAARDVCTGLAPYFRLTDQSHDATIRLRALAIRPTSAGTAGLSEVVGFFVPGPFRIPAGLGGLAIDGELHQGDRPVVVLQWSQGANPLTEGARISAIGDAYQLAGDFADDFVAAAVASSDDGRRRERLDDDTVAANRRLCISIFGKANIAVAGASFLIGLPPEAMDQGAAAAAGDAAPGD